MTRRSTTTLALALLLLSFAGPARAQRVLGPGEDAFVLPRGQVRVRVSSDWATYDERYGGGAGGDLVPGGADFSLPMLGAAQFPALAATQESLRALSGNPSFVLSLGSSELTSDVRITRTPLELSAGLLSRLTLGVVVPFVRTTNDVAFRVNRGSAEAANVGPNPALVAPGAASENSALVTQLRDAASALEGSLGGSAFCAANPGDASCQLVANTRAFAAGIESVYGTSQAEAGAFVPLATSQAQRDIVHQIAVFRQAYGALGGAITTPAPIGAGAPVGSDAVQALLTDATYGVNPLQRAQRGHVGDIEVAAKLLLVNSVGAGAARLRPTGVNLRSAVTGVLRLGTGQHDSPTNLLDVGADDGQTDVEVRSNNDLFLGGHFWASVNVRYGVQMKDQRVLRVPEAPGQVLVPAARLQKVDRDLGDFVEVELDPHYDFTDYFAVSSHYLYRRKGEDVYTGAAGGADPSILGVGTETREHRVGAGVTYSTLAAAIRGRGGLPLEISLVHYRTVKGTGRLVPKLSADVLRLSVYTRLFGK